MNLFGRKNIYYDSKTKGFRWPASKSDSYASENYYKERTLEQVKACRMGALLALPSTIKIDQMGLETQPAKILAEAFQNYGAYLVDDTGWDVYAIVTEWSPKGRFVDEFKNNWGFNFVEGNKDTPWTRDIRRIFSNLNVVDNNSSSSIGGGGMPRLPLAPIFE